MDKIFVAIDNIKHGDQFLKAGTVFQGVVSEFAQLIEDGAIRLLDEARDIAHGVEIIAAEQAQKVEAEQAKESEAPQDTWGPAKEPVVAPEETQATDTETTTPVVAPELAKFNVLKEFEVTDETSKNFGKHAIGEVIEANPVAAASLIADGTLAPVDVPTGDNL